MSDFSYDPFDPAVMADPLPYYRVLRDEHPVYYLPKWDTFALSRFSDIWEALRITDGTFVASEGTLPVRRMCHFERPSYFITRWAGPTRWISRT